MNPDHLAENRTDIHRDEPSRKKIILIAGPCSAESEDQIRREAAFFNSFNQANHPFQINVFRAGVWKPRSRPGMFEGKGEEALKWLADIQHEFGIPTSTEVASPVHAELCLRYGISQVWIGARTSANPFLMQEIAQALRGCQIPIWVKNPISPDLGLWIGGIERMQVLCKGKVGAVHRGFSIFNPEPYRNAPLWELPIELKRECPELPIIHDPSHVAGKRHLVSDLAQRALDLEMDGLMIEVHENPCKALSDAAQQLDFETFSQLIDKLVLKRRSSNSSRISKIRYMLDDIDDELIQLLGKRMQLVAEVGAIKKEENLSVLQMGRWNEVVERCQTLARTKGLHPEFVQNLLNCMHTEAIRLQQEIIDKKN